MIDAHAHLWQLGRNGCVWPTPDFAPIYRDFSIEDLRAAAQPSRVDGVILVQSQEGDADTDWLLSLIADPLIAGIVGWTDFLASNAPAAIERLAANPKLKGLRPMVQDRESDWYDSPALDPVFAAVEGLHLVLDALLRPRHLPSLFRLASRHPVLSVVIDHGAKPAPADFDSWSELIGLIARLPNVSCKLSGLLTELPPGATDEDVAPLFDRLWNAFGAERLIWGSDWPVLTLAGDYGSWLAQCRRLVPSIHHQAVFASNACRTYRI